ncbi:MAG: membrane integrity-associated transporter subunit PqiC [Wenzhouxiangella sp.]|nr:membrane integrity-associated transporter subunit PqiC [Wenzhouxiangella sp.]TVR91571.1 MAG: hypothetical protein EA418_13915 [Wenzhouxiangellaceae bacterium]
MTEQGTLRLLALFLLTMPLLTACALVRNPAPLSILAPAVDVQPRSDQERVDWSLQIQRPMADAMRDSDRVLVRRSASRLQVYAGAAWLDSVPEMLQSKLVRVFADSGAFTGVSRAGGMRTRYSLASEIRHFEAIDDGGPDLVIEVVMQFNLVHQRSARPVATGTLAQRQRVDGKSIDALVGGFEQALEALLDELIDWVLAESRAFETRAADIEPGSRRWRRED